MTTCSKPCFTASRFAPRFLAQGFCFILLSLAFNSGAASVTNIVSFAASNAPMSGLVLAWDGNLYGTTLLGGNSNAGTIFGIDTNGNYFPVYSFKGGTNGANPYSTLIVGQDGALYGTTALGGSGHGTVFRMGLGAGGVFNRLHSFNGTSEGGTPYGGLVQVPGGEMYGTTVYGSTYNYGSIYQINTNGGFTAQYAFTGGGDGAYPFCQLLLATDGFLYGTTSESDVTNGGFGTLFVFSPSGPQFETLHAFTGSASDGSYPYGGLVELVNGVLYGTSAALAPTGNEPNPSSGIFGTVFSIPLVNNVVESTSLIHDFTGLNDGAYPYAGLFLASDGNLYGTTAGLNNDNGTVFAVYSGGTLYSNVVVFNGGNGSEPYGNLVQGLDGNLYGTTKNGGVAGGGTVFRIPMLAPPFVVRSPVAQTAYNQTPATFSVVAGGSPSLSYVWKFNNSQLTDTTNINGTFSNVLTIVSATSSNQGNYSVLVTGPYGQVTSASARLTVTPIKPTVTVIAPVANAQLTNSSLVVTGRASEVLGVAAVYCQINTQAWVQAMSPNNYTNWSAGVSLDPGTNTLKVYAADPYGNLSATNTIKFTYVVPATIVVLTNGFGKITPDYNGQSLAVGETFSMMAQGVNGCAFTNWTGSIQTNSAKLTFVMAAGLSFTANFVDVTPPTVTVTTPTSGQHVSNAVFTVTGKASDNVGLAAVHYQINSAGWNLAGPVGATLSNWTATVMLVPGTNTLRVYATDMTGNNSATNTLNFIYVLSAQITIQTNGTGGTVSPNLNGQLLAIGQTYTVTATPVKGFGFQNWTGSIPTNTAKLTFVMESNLVLTANFVDTNAPTVTVAAPTSGQHVSNAVFIVTGKASDNVDVAAVQYQLNLAGWYPAAPATNSTTLSNWVAAVMLTPGTNTLQVVAIDSAGNHSATNTVKFVYVLSAQILIQTNGTGGTVSPNLNGQLLAIGQSYTVTAEPVKGFKFTNWTGSIPTNTAKLTFVMESNLVLTANFVDTNAPTVSVTAPTSGQHVSNAVFIVTGKASDNVDVAAVQYQLNLAGWYPAVPATNSTTLSNWVAAVMLTPGTNTLQVVVIDSAGNHSATNTVKFVYVLSAQITIETNGTGGTVSPNLNGQLLAIGQSYTVTAEPVKGFKFSNWTGSIPTNTAKLTFVMESNLVLTANFVDTNAPTVSVTTPTSGQHVSNVVFTVTGKASDNVDVAAVQYQLNLAGWYPAAPATNSTTLSNWVAAVILTPGTNTLQVVAIDSAGNHSATNTVKFVYVLSAQITIETNGTGGTVSPNLNGQLLAIGQSYTVTAVPVKGFKFSNWTGSIPTNTAKLTFVMESNLVLTANFVDTNAPTVTVTTPTSGQHVSNAVFTVTGKASDNVDVAAVQYQLNLAGWYPAAPATNSTTLSNWVASVMLTPGTNTLQVVAIDSAGNHSATNTVKFVYVLSAQILIETNGTGGTVSPNLNGDLLAIGQSYTVTAMPVKGFKFTDWTGSIPTNTAKLTFVMESNLVLTANFMDTNLPTVTITAPTANQRVTNAMFTVTGKSTDNVGVAAVYYQLNSGGWNPASQVSGSWSNWTATVNLAVTTNVIQAYSQDAAGNKSPTATTHFTYVP